MRLPKRGEYWIARNSDQYDIWLFERDYVKNGQNSAKLILTSCSHYQENIFYDMNMAWKWSKISVDTLNEIKAQML